MWGDHSQELFSVQQSFEKEESVFVGNDWVSTLRYFHYQKYAFPVVPQAKNKWWGGFMGPSVLLMVDGIPLQGPLQGPLEGPSKKPRTEKRKSKKRKSKKRKTKKIKSKKRKTKKRV